MAQFKRRVCYSFEIVKMDEIVLVTKQRGFQLIYKVQLIWLFFFSGIILSGIISDQVTVIWAKAN